eukprot:2126570-Rhodomonas_salina.2
MEMNSPCKPLSQSMSTMVQCEVLPEPGMRSLVFQLIWLKSGAWSEGRLGRSRAERTEEAMDLDNACTRRR